MKNLVSILFLVMSCSFIGIFSPNIAQAQVQIEPVTFLGQTATDKFFRLTVII